MNIHIGSDDLSRMSLQKVDMKRFLSHLSQIGNSNFTDVVVKTAWGLVIFQFQGPRGQCTCAVNVELLLITGEMVVNDQGQVVDRYSKVAEELHKRATDKLALSPDKRELKSSNILRAS